MEGNSSNKCRNVHESVVFLLQNLFEMNRLWIRMQFIGPKGKEDMKEDRKDYEVFVGECIYRLGTLEGVTKEIYKNLLIPRLLSLISRVKESISQEYLTACVIQFFPSEFHLFTMEMLLKHFVSLESSVDVLTLFVSLIGRLINCASKQPKELIGICQKVFEIVRKFADKILEEQRGVIPLDKLIELECMILKFALICYPNDIMRVESVFSLVFKLLEEKEFTMDTFGILAKLLAVPLDTLALSVVCIPQFSPLTNCLSPKLKSNIQKEALFSLIRSRSSICDIEILKKLLTFITPLIEGEAGNGENSNEFEKIQSNIARIPHLVQCSDALQEYTFLSILKERFLKGEASKMKITLPSLIWRLFILGAKKEELQAYTLAYDLISTLSSYNAEAAINLLLQGTVIIKTKELKLEYINKALSLYKERINGNYKLLVLIIGTLSSINIEGDLAIEVLKSSSELTNKKDQCKALLMCSHIFCNPYVIL